jgi:ABC-2 type transport system permease protein
LCYPALISFGVLREAPWIYYLEALGVLVTFLLFAGLTGTTIAAAFAPIVRRLSTRHIIVFGIGLLATLGWVFLRSFRFWDMDGDNNLLILDRFASQLSFLQSPYFPGSWASTAVLAAASENHQEVFFCGSVLLANTLFFLPFLSLYASQYYGRQWVLSRTRAPERVKSLEQASEDSGRLAGSPLRALVGKDMLVFLRDPAQLSQSVLFVLLMVIYSLSLLLMPEYLTQKTFRFVIFFANLGAVCALLSSFTSRFLFPLISLEGRAFWIVGLAPVPRAYLLYQKAIFGLSLTLFLGVVTALVSNLALGYPTSLVLGALYTIVLAGTCLTSLAIGLGAAYPNFLEDNPARIAVRLGGTLNFFASALSVALLVGIEAFPYLARGITNPNPPPASTLLIAHGAALLFTLCLSGFCLQLGRRALNRCEF